jgi:phage shock protein E
MKPNQISVAQLFTKIAQMPAGDIVLDVRTPQEYSAGHIKGSINIPYDLVVRHLEDLRKFGQIYVHCRSGKRAEAAAQVLLSAGFTNLICVSGSGMDDWIRAGYPFERSA